MKRNRYILIALAVLAILMYRWDLEKYGTKRSSLSRNNILVTEYYDLIKIEEKLVQFKLLLEQLQKQVSEIEKKRAEALEKGLTHEKEGLYLEITAKLEEVKKSYQDKLSEHLGSRAAYNERYITNINEYNNLSHPLIIHRNDLPILLEGDHFLKEKFNKAL